MKDLLKFIVENLATKPEAVLVDEQVEEGNVNLNLTIDPSDMGLIIGKSGQTIRAIRKLLTVRAIAENVRVNIQLIEPEGHTKPEPQEKSKIESPAEDQAGLPKIKVAQKKKQKSSKKSAS